MKKILPGKPLEGRLLPADIIRLLSRINLGGVPAGFDSPCWLWSDACTDKRGYGQFKWRGKARWVHRVAHEVFKGPVPDGLEVDHLVMFATASTQNTLRQRR